MENLDPVQVEKTLRHIIASLDYDLHKYTERDEDEGKDHYPDLAREFIAYYEAKGP